MNISFPETTTRYQLVAQDWVKTQRHAVVECHGEHIAVSNLSSCYVVLQELQDFELVQGDLTSEKLLSCLSNQKAEFGAYHQVIVEMEVDLVCIDANHFQRMPNEYRSVKSSGNLYITASRRRRLWRAR